MAYKRLERFLIQLDSIDSTNSYANGLLKGTKVVNGTAVLTHHQHNGRGQRSNTWTTEPGKNLTCSVILLSNVPVKYSFYLNIVVSLAVRKALSDLGLDVEIKWPNDILIGRKKVCGILIENQISGTRINSSVVGIGLNVNQENFDDLPRATSLRNELGYHVEVMDVFEQVYNYLDFYYNLLLESNFELLLRHYYNHLFLLNKSADFEDQKGGFNGTIAGIDENGRLLIQRDGKVMAYDLKEISYRY